MVALIRVQAAAEHRILDMAELPLAIEKLLLVVEAAAEIVKILLGSVMEELVEVLLGKQCQHLHSSRLELLALEQLRALATPMA